MNRQYTLVKNLKPGEAFELLDRIGDVWWVARQLPEGVILKKPWMRRDMKQLFKDKDRLVRRVE
jgi:hypothetical protein